MADHGPEIRCVSVMERDSELELITFVVLAAGAYFIRRTKRRSAVYSWFFLFTVYSLVVRTSPPTLDMVAYHSALTVWPPPVIQYTLREPIIWLGAPLVYKILGSEVFTFMLFDVTTGLIVIRAVDRMEEGRETMLPLGPMILVSYVFLMGQQNGWRQQVAFAIFLWACSARSNHQRRALLLLVLSVLAHNSTALLSGYWFDVGRNGRRRYGPLITLVGVSLVGLLLPYLAKSSSVTGLRTEYLYVALAVVLYLVVVYSSSGRLPRGSATGLVNFAAFVPAIVILGSTQFERMAMMFLVLILVDMWKHHGPLQLSRPEVVNMVFAILVAPVFLFPNALNMLLI